MSDLAPRAQGTVVTFYSYKGGVGRTFLLANVAWLLASWGKRVLCLDWDLEAPGLHRYLAPFAKRRRGVADLLFEFQQHSSTADLDWQDLKEDLDEEWAPTGCLHLIGAGRGDDDYVEKVQRLDWNRLSQTGLERWLEERREEWVSAYDLILVDSRTGITDIGGLCAAQLPDLLVLTFTASYQSLEGATEVARRAATTRDKMPIDRGGFEVLPIPCRIHVGDEDRLEQEWMDRFASLLDSQFQPWKSREIEVGEYLAHLKVREQARWSFGEQLPVRSEDHDDPSRVSYAFASAAALIDQRLVNSGDVVRKRHEYLQRSIRPRHEWSRQEQRQPGLPKVFISYPSEEKEVASQLYEKLDHNGFPVVIDYDSVDLGDDFSSALYSLRERAEVFVVLVSGQTSDGRPQWDEIRHILRRQDEGVRVIPVFLDDDAYSAAPQELTSLFGLDLTAESGIDGVAEKIIENLRRSWRRQPARKTQEKETLPGSEIGLEWVRVAGGTFSMGEASIESAQPVQTVSVPPFWIGKYPITNRQYSAFVEALGYEHSGSSTNQEKVNHPVTQVSWYDAMAFCEWLGENVTLPSEAQWEFAARSTEGRTYPWGNERISTDRANYAKNFGGTTPVGHYPEGATPDGIHDLAGNVWEWGLDAWNESYEGTPADGSARKDETTSGFRVLRGGSWYNPAFRARSADRKQVQA